MGQTSGNATIYSRLANVSLAGLEGFFFVAGSFGSFFRVVPLSSYYSNPKKAGCGDNKRPCNRALKKIYDPWALILAIFGFFSLLW